MGHQPVVGNHKIGLSTVQVRQQFVGAGAGDHFVVQALKRQHQRTQHAGVVVHHSDRQTVPYRHGSRSLVGGEHPARRHFNREHRTTPQPGAQADLQAQQGRRFGDDRQPQPAAPRPGFVQLGEFFKDHCGLVVWNAKAGVPDFHPLSAFTAPAGHQHTALAGVLDCVVDEVAQNAAQQQHIAVGESVRASPAQTQALCLRFGAMDRHQRRQQIGHGEIAQPRRHHAGVEFAHIQQVSQQFAQAVDAVLNREHQIQTLRRHALLEHAHIQRQRRQRLAQVMAGRRQKMRLGLVGLLSHLARHAQLGGALRDQLLQMVAVLRQFLIHTPGFGNVLLHRHIVSDAAVVLAQWRDDGPLDVVAAVPAPVDKFPAPHPALGQGSP